QATRDRMMQRWRSIAHELSLPEPVPLPFTNDVAAVTAWRVAEERPAEKGHATLERAKGSDGRQTLSIVAITNTTASWRSRLLLEGGRYRFEGLARAAQIVPLPIKPPPQPPPDQNQNPAVPAEKKGEGAGLRISGTQKPRENKL